jgi:uncharacterized membrane protein YoaK (UPF0700 family)
MIHAASAPSVDSALGMKLLPSVLGLTSGAVDVISFLGLGGLFAAHITGNLVILAAHLVNGGAAPVAHILCVPVFMAALGRATLRPLLALQALLLVGAFVLGVSAGAPFDPTAPRAVTAGMLAVAAMSVQNALVQISLTGAPSTAVMTTNITRFIMDLGAVLLERDPHDVASVRRRAWRTAPVIAGFVVGCGLGAAWEAVYGVWSLLLPAGFAFAALALGFNVSGTTTTLSSAPAPRPGTGSSVTQAVSGPSAPGLDIGQSPGPLV